MIEPENNSVMLVDGLNLAFRWKHSGAKEFVDAYIRTVESLAKSYKCSKTIICSDFGSSSYRRNIFPEYKGNREELRANQTEKEAEDFKDFIEEFNNALAHLEIIGYTVLKYKKVEADDIIAYICGNMKNFDIEKIWIISSDKDLDLLINDKVSRFSYVTRKEITINDWPYDVEPDMYMTYKCLTGDKGDNVPGVPGIGPKRATQIIEQYGDVFDICSQIPLPGKQKFIESLNSMENQLLTNVELMDLVTFCEEAIGQNNCKDIKEKILNGV